MAGPACGGIHSWLRHDGSTQRQLESTGSFSGVAKLKAIDSWAVIQGMAGKRKVVVKGLTSPKNKRRTQVAKKLAKQANAGINGCTGMGSKPKR